MDALTRTRLLKLLALTASSHDGEALAASRMANKLLKRTGSSGGGVFCRPQRRPRHGPRSSSRGEPSPERSRRYCLREIPELRHRHIRRRPRMDRRPAG